MVCDGRIRLKLETSRPGRVSKRGDPPVVLKTATVKTHVLDAGRLGTLSNSLANSLGRGAISTERHLLTQRLVRRARRCQRPTTHVINDLSVDVLVRAKHRQPWPLRSALKPLPNTKATTCPLAKVRSCVVHVFRSRTLS